MRTRVVPPPSLPSPPLPYPRAPHRLPPVTRVSQIRAHSRRRSSSTAAKQRGRDEKRRLAWLGSFAELPSSGPDTQPPSGPVAELAVAGPSQPPLALARVASPRLACPSQGRATTCAIWRSRSPGRNHSARHHAIHTRKHDNSNQRRPPPRACVRACALHRIDISPPSPPPVTLPLQKTATTFSAVVVATTTTINQTLPLSPAHVNSNPPPTRPDSTERLTTPYAASRSTHCALPLASESRRP